MEAAQSGMIWRLAKRIAWVHSGRAGADYPDFDVMTFPLLRTAGLAPGVAPAQPHVAAAGTSKYKQSQVTDQGDGSEFVAPTRQGVDTWSANYFQQEQVHSQEDEEPSEIQVKGLQTRIDLGKTPYVDFGICGPYGRKLMRALKFRTWIPNGDGSFTAKEVPGPENFNQYTIIWKVFRASCLMLRCVMGSP